MNNYCTTCDERIENNIEFCPRCGVKIINNQEIEECSSKMDE